ncbi:MULTISPECIES: outer membrane protein assembly factor BamB family protein [unclassified Nocardia]|uniref:outer membrane protein assembly factor BamB family protein n=1 Tax=unclassified Nocardia TaxID=2637762 RepID=UPI0033A4E1FD
MSDDQSTVPARSPWPVLAGLIGAVLVTGGVALALYSQFVAAPIPVPFGRHAETGEFPFRLVRGTLIFAGAVVLIGAVVVVRGRRDDERAAGVTASGVLVLLAALIGGIVFAVTAHIPSTYQRLTSIFVATPRVPSAIAALALVVLGAVLIFVLVASPSAPVPRRWALAVALVIGIVAVLGAAGVAVRLGDDTAAVDHVTADPGPESAVPAVLGPEKFRFQVPVARSHKDTRIAFTGTGFVVSTRVGVTAYDGATGSERWHYRRLDVRSDTVGNVPELTKSLRGEKVVLTYWEKRGWMAFDTVTGALLWTEADFTRDGDFTRSGDFNVDGHFAIDDDATVRGHLLATTSARGAVTRYDARTGRNLWTTPSETPGCTSTGERVVATMTAIYRAATCGAGDTATVTVTVFDPQSGQVRDRRSFPAPREESPGSLEVRVLDSGFVWMTLFHDGADTELLLPPNAPLTSAIVDSSRNDIDVRAADNDVLISTYHPDGYKLPKRWEVLSGADGESTELDTTSDERAQYAEAAALLADQIVTLTPDDGYTLRTWDRSTGRAGPVRPVTVASATVTLRFTTVAGSLVLIATDNKYRDIEVVGFG